MILRMNRSLSRLALVVASSTLSAPAPDRFDHRFSSAIYPARDGGEEVQDLLRLCMGQVASYP
jgi:hypothetical protein